MKQIWAFVFCVSIISAPLCRAETLAEQNKGSLGRMARYPQMKPKGVPSLLAGESMKLAQRQNYHEKVEEALNAHLRMEFQAFYTYRAIAAYFGRSDIALPGFYQFFKGQSEEELEHAQQFIDYMNTRGGIFIAQDLDAPPYDFKSGTAALKTALKMERDVNESLLKLHSVAEEHGDPQFTDFLEGNFLNEQVEALKEIADLLTNIDRVGNEGLGLYVYDRQLQANGPTGAGALGIEVGGGGGGGADAGAAA
ncbi:unnamed protein product [Vitrella brassicaformis CCMP3155]|uniref:Ferritin n=2 Tax=Vitrella brassicaformis TaxID=1169539 RepID=A0A0G4ECC8_VITBC|nr:unnamed protein product [Vitrella brassicaformis CCMP3155]|eukprot:CEL93591.1 unnamed protein product [Vitrella brassicaformis CCMP3155]